MKRIAVIFENLGPYHIARLKAAAQRSKLLAIEVASISMEYAWQRTSDFPFECKTLFQIHQGEKKKSYELIKRLKACLSDFSPDAVAIPGWSGTHAVAGLRLALNTGIPVVLMSESQQSDFSRILIKEWIKQYYVGLCQSALVGGTSHRAYMKKLGMEAKYISMGYDVVDNDYFTNRVNETRKIDEHLRQQHGLPEQYFLASARFIPKKNLQRLVKAYAEYRCAVKCRIGNVDACWHLVVLGDGELRSKLEVLINKLGLVDFVHLPGFKQYQDLPIYYGLASGFIHASTTEPWGLVVNEAMASGLPILVSVRCGCAPDLVENGRNGYTFDPYDVEALSRLMTKISSDYCDRRAMGLASLEIINRWTPETFADGLASAVETALASPCPTAGLIDKLLLRVLSLR